MEGITVAAYYFPNWHPNPQNDAAHGRGWTEWEVVKCARPRFAGHRQPRVPLWGYEDESRPEVMNRKIEAARRHGIDCFLFDWYYHNEGPFREEALNKGFLAGGTLGGMKFAVMWCNHSRQGLHPAPYTMTVETFADSKVSTENYEAMTDHLVRDYFRHPNYWKIEGKPFFALYSIRQMIDDCGSFEACSARLERLREKTRRAGFPGIHLHVISCFLESVPEQERAEWIRLLKIDSQSDYSWQCEDGFPVTDAETVRLKMLKRWHERIGHTENVFYPTVMTGWDASPRTLQSDLFEPRGYPWCAVWNQTPEEFKFMLTEAKRLLVTRPETERICLLTAWNEWTEGAYLEPDTHYGYRYLEAVADVFACNEQLILQENK